MINIFLSYSTKDHYFAELAVDKLKGDEIELWRDMGQIRAGEEWRTAIDQAISKSHAVLVALSNQSANSSYVTYEWAYAIGKGKPIIPLRLEECEFHPRLQITQFLDFSVPGNLPWELLVERIKEIEFDAEGAAVSDNVEQPLQVGDPNVTAILAYLNQRGYQMASFDRLRERIDKNLRKIDFEKIVEKNPSIFRKATLKGKKPGLAKKIP